MADEKPEGTSDFQWAMRPNQSFEENQKSVEDLKNMNGKSTKDIINAERAAAETGGASNEGGRIKTIGHGSRTI